MKRFISFLFTSLLMLQCEEPLVNEHYATYDDSINGFSLFIEILEQRSNVSFQRTRPEGSEATVFYFSRPSFYESNVDLIEDYIFSDLESERRSNIVIFEKGANRSYLFWTRLCEGLADASETGSENVSREEEFCRFNQEFRKPMDISFAINSIFGQRTMIEETLSENPVNGQWYFKYEPNPEYVRTAYRKYFENLNRRRMQSEREFDEFEFDFNPDSSLDEPEDEIELTDEQQNLVKNLSIEFEPYLQNDGILIGTWNLNSLRLTIVADSGPFLSYDLARTELARQAENVIAYILEGAPAQNPAEDSGSSATSDAIVIEFFPLPEHMLDDFGMFDVFMQKPFDFLTVILIFVFVLYLWSKYRPAFSEKTEMLSTGDFAEHIEAVAEHIRKQKGKQNRENLQKRRNE